MNREKRIAGRRVRRRRRIRVRLIAYAAAAGIALMPWQIEVTVRLLDGEYLQLTMGRRN
ncbi:hypothetical protein [Microbacterium allomyrinae]|uniref:Uncharacterized protein n=1 Tax=Microbacterium allomyrinae TaxID=2830666 RepID=A0A9X1S3C9_9MICO|nr:hypothetical protein [Microbacterium allomyrinae]MCC2031813.1 hypothetical protein [Microbacterium allomyrinae]